MYPQLTFGASFGFLSVKLKLELRHTGKVGRITKLVITDINFV